MITNLCKQKAIILQLLDPESVNNFPMTKVTFPVETAPQPSTQKSGTSKLAFRFFLTDLN